MALTKVTGQVIKNTTDVTVGVLTVTNTLAVGGTVSIGGTLTYEDVTNVDAVGLITARNGIVVGSGITLSKDGDIFATGVTTATTFVGAVTGNVTGNVTGTIQTASQTNITSVGTLTGLTVSGDVNIADKIFHTGDSDTAIRFPEADNISLETGGSERLRLNNQYLIKGHTTVYPIAGHYPSVQLTGTTFNDATLSLINNANDATGSYIYLSKQRSGSQGGATVVQDDDLVGQIGWTAGDGTDVTSRIAEIKGMIDGTPGSNDTPGRLSFWTTADGAQSSTERLRIDSSGRLLVGTTTEGEVNADDFTLASSGNTGMTIRSGTSHFGSIYFSDGTSGNAEYRGLIAYNHPSDYLQVFVGATERLRVNSSGHLQLGTTTATVSAGKALMIAASDGARIKLCDSDLGVGISNGYEILVSGNGTAYVWNRENTDLLFGTNNTERLRITSVGGVENTGGSSSHYVLTNAGKAINHIHVDGPTGNSGEMGGAISFDCGGTGCAAIAGLQQSSDNDKIGLAFIVHQSSNSADDAIEAMRIDNDGQVAIGADGASSPLHVKGITGTLGVQAYPQLTLQTASTNGAADTGAGIMFLGHDGSGGAFHGTIRGLKENGTTSNRNSYMSFGTRTNGQDIAERMRISSSSVGQVFIGCTQEPTGGNSGIMLQGNGFAVVAYAGSGSANVFEFNNSNNTVGRINCNGSNTSYLTNSDYRLKENESAISDGITRLKNLKPYRFNFKNEPSVTQDGFFAHEVSSAVPIAVLGDKDATKEDGSIEPQSIDHSKLVPLLTAALQEEISKRESLETRIAALEG